MSNAKVKSKSVLKKIAGVVVDFDICKYGAELRVDGEYVVGAWRPYSETQRKQNLALIDTLRKCLDAMYEQHESCDVVVPKVFKNLDAAID